MTTEPHPTDPARPVERDWLTWTTAALGASGVLVVGWACLTQWGGIVHGHWAYAALLVGTLLASVATAPLGLQGRRRGPRRARGTVLGVAVVLLGAGWLALTAWLRPHTAIEPALAAMSSDAAVTVTETGTEIVMTPTSEADGTGVFFQPGALVDARAYAAVLRPLAEAGHTVVITKQPLGVAFLAVGAFDDARSRFPDVTGWVLGGHSLGGVVASTEADAADEDATAPAVGLLLYASYPAGDVSESLTVPVMSISGSQDGLSAPAKIEASRSDLPADATFVQVEGASHAQFGSYGPQAGDGTPTIGADEARSQISAASLQLLAGISG